MGQFETVPTEAGVERRFGDLTDLVTKNHDGIVDVRRDVRALGRRMDKRFDAVDERFNEIERALTDLRMMMVRRLAELPEGIDP